MSHTCLLCIYCYLLYLLYLSYNKCINNTNVPYTLLQMSNRPTVSALLHTEFPKLMRTTALTRSLSSMQRNQVNDQIARIKRNFAKLQREMVDKAKNLILEEGNYQEVKISEERKIIYCNNADNLIQFDPKNRVTKGRIMNFNSEVPLKGYLSQLSLSSLLTISSFSSISSKRVLL